MDFAMKGLLFYVMCCAALCNAEQNLVRDGQACVVQYLKGKGKLTESFPSTGSPSSLCRLVIPASVQIVNGNVKYQVGKEFPNEVDCLTAEFENKDGVDYLLQLDLIRSSSLSASAKNTQLENTKSQFKDMLEEIAVQCHVDDKNFVKLFNEALGIKNETLEAHQNEYCMAKYVFVDNQLLEVNNVDINPHRIETNSVNCEYLIDIERSNAEKELSDKLSATETGQSSLNCVVNAFRSGNMFNYRVALKVLGTLDITSQEKERETNKISKKISEFVLTTVACAMG